MSWGPKWVSCRQHTFGSCFCIHSASPCLLLGAFYPFIFKVMTGKNLQPRILYSASLSFRHDGEIKSFPEKQKLREFSTTKLEWVAMLSSSGSSQPRDQPCVSCVSCIASGFFTIEPTWKINRIIHIYNYLKCKWIKCTKQKIDWPGRWKHVHVCTSTYHITLLNFSK